MSMLRRALALILLVAPTVGAQPQPQTQPSVAETRARELTKLLQLGRRDSLEALITRSYSSGFLGSAPMTTHVNFFQGALHLARDAQQIGTRNVTPYSATVYWYSPLMEDWYGIAMKVDSVAPHGVIQPPAVARATPPANASAPTRAKSAQAAWQSLDVWVKRLAEADRFSGVVLVARGNQIIGVNGYGDASKEFGVKITPSTRMIFGSIGKMFTAVSILQLIEQGTISFDDPLAKYLPGVIAAPADTAIRIKHLLTHTSGLADFLFRPQMSAANRAQYRLVADFLPLLKNDAPAFTPGTKWAYSNTGFLLLGAILEKVEGIPYDSVIAKRVFQRAGMTETQNLDLDLVPKGIAFTYTREFTSFGQHRWRSDRYVQPVHGTPAGGGWSTAADLARFVDALRGNKLLSADMTARMLTPKPDMSSPNYGFGTQIFDATANLVGHTGGGPGTAAFVQFDKTTGLTAIVLSNNAGPSGDISRRIFATFPDL
jgi:CubicO group peptidase (beta-lactamase class C family)